jgi:tetratricopeptide (TPR) repeat protein
VLWGNGIEPDSKKGEGRVGQVAATIMALLKLPRAAGTYEPALGGVPEVLPAQNYGPRTARLLVASDSGPAGDAVERLKALGYVGSNEPAVRPEGAGTGTRTAGSFTNEGSLLLEDGKNAEAKAAFEQALRLDAKSAAAKYALASILEKEGRSGEADDLLLAALADGLGEGPEKVEEIAVAAWRMGDVPRALRLLDGVVKTKPDEARFRMTRGRVRIQSRDCQGAFEDFDAACKTAPGSAAAFGLAGSALMCLGRPAEARRAFERSLEIDPSQTRLRELLSRDR